MRIGLAGIGPLANAHRLDTIRNDATRHVADILQKLFEPALEVEAVPKDEVGILRLHDVERRRLIIVDLGAWLRDGFDHRFIASDVLSDVLDHREGCYDLERPATGVGLFGRSASRLDPERNESGRGRQTRPP